MTDELLPCPFCGEYPILKPGIGRSEIGSCWYVCHKSGDGHNASTGLQKGEEDARAVWNTRATDPEVAQLKEELRLALDALEEAHKNRWEPFSDEELEGAFDPRHPFYERMFDEIESELERRKHER